MTLRTLVLAALFLSTAVAALAEGPAPLRLGIVGFAKDATARTGKVLQDYLAQGLGRPVRCVVFPSYPEILHDLANENLDLAVLTPIVYLNAQEACRIHALGYAVFVSGDFTYRAVILTKKDSPARRLADLAGRRMAFVDKLSASGYILPRLMLTRAGVKGARDVKAVFTGNHVDAIKALQSGRVDAAVTYDTLFREVPDLGARMTDFRLVDASEPIPADAFVASARVDAGLRGRIRELLLDYHTAQRKEARWRSPVYTGFVPPDPNLYEGLRKLYASLTAR